MFLALKTCRNIAQYSAKGLYQWDNFRLLLLEGLSQGADSLIVGDVKQSIYRWRNGDWGIPVSYTHLDVYKRQTIHLFAEYIQ